jgi:hypothetical protein
MRNGCKFVWNDPLPAETGWGSLTRRAQIEFLFKAANPHNMLILRPGMV